MKQTILLIASICILASCNSKSTSNKELLGNWIEVMPVNLDITEGITLKEGGEAESIGMATLLYSKWKKENDILILWGKSIGNGQTIDFSDTLSIAKITPDSLILDKYGMYRIKYYKVDNINDIKTFNILDSLKKVDYTTNIITRTYKGSLPIPSCIEVKSELTIYNYENCGDGVYKLSNTYLRADGENAISNSYGRLYTLRGDASNPDAVVYQLIPFKYGETLSFLYQPDNLILLNDKMEKIEGNQLKLTNP